MLLREDLVTGNPYQSYTYSYPHKTAYRVLPEAISLSKLWSEENRDSLFLYLHIPFCEMRCGFCNLFTTTNPKTDFVTAYLDTLERQATVVREGLGKANFTRLAIGGGTPTFLTVPELARLFNLAEKLYGIDLAVTPISVETSPGTTEVAKLQLLKERGVDRISIGIQSFWENEVRAVGRAQKTPEVVLALERIKSFSFPSLNIDLIYGLPEQSVASWLASLEAALKFEPEELYLYPLYNRPLTGLDHMGKKWEDIRLECYREGRALLQDSGYDQVSMRMFQLKNMPKESSPVYCCQEDGMVGLGCGARSYTRTHHYSSEYAVSTSGVKAILSDYIRRSAKDFRVANYGYILDEADQRRRYLLQTLLQAEGLDLASYQHHFGTSVMKDLPQLYELVQSGLAVLLSGKLKLTPAGLERSDTIGPWLYSAKAKALMEEYELR